MSEENVEPLKNLSARFEFGAAFWIAIALVVLCIVFREHVSSLLKHVVNP